MLETPQEEFKSQILELIKKTGHTEEEYSKREKELGEEDMFKLEKAVSLKVLDTLWQSHLSNMDHLRDSVKLRAYGGHDPLVEYKNEGHKMFQRLLEEIDMSIADSVFKANLQPQKQPTMSLSGVEPVKSKAEVGRNDPCSCGKKDSVTGKPIKYKSTAKEKQDALDDADSLPVEKELKFKFLDSQKNEKSLIIKYKEKK